MMKKYLITTKSCVKCPVWKELLDNYNADDIEILNEDNSNMMEIASSCGVSSAPTFVEISEKTGSSNKIETEFEFNKYLKSNYGK